VRDPWDKGLAGSLHATRPAGLLLAFLNAGLPYSVPKTLRGKPFLVVLDDNGKPTASVVSDVWRAKGARLAR